MRTRNNQRLFDLLKVLRSNPRASYRELCQATGIKSTSVIAYYLAELEREGCIRRERTIARGIYVTGNSPRPVKRSRRVKTSAAKIKGHSVSALTPKPDSDLDARIEMIGLREDARMAAGSGVDVVRDYPHSRTLKAYRLG